MTNSINLKRFSIYFLFQLKSLIRKKSFYLLFFVPLVFMLATMTIGTFEMFYIGVLSGTFLISTLFIYSYFILGKNIFSNNVISKFEKHLSSLLLIIFFNLFIFISIVFYFYLFAIILNILNLNQSFIIQWNNISFDFNYIEVGMVIYYLIFFTIMAYSFYYLFSNIFRTSKLFFSFSITYIIFTIFFGGVIGSVFNYQVNSLDASSTTNEIYLEPILKNQLGLNFVISNFFSCFFLNQFCYLMFLNVNFPSGIFSNFTIGFKYFEFYSSYWIFIIIMPYVWILFYLILGFYFNKKNDYI